MIRSLVRFARLYLLWPLLLCAALTITWTGIAHGYSFLAFNLAYLGLAACLFLAERRWPYERAWLENDGQIGVDLAHTVLNKSAVQVLVAVGAVFGVAEVARGTELHGVWPGEWWLPAQVLLALVLVEAGLYAAHRLAHEWRFLWRFHAVHHSAPRLTFINTGRFHLVDTVTSILLSQPILFLAGAPIEIFKWVSATTAFIGMLTHCNVEMRFGFLNYIVNTPVLHRFHHSRDLKEGNRNYGENLMIFDLLFGTHHYARYRPSVRIGIDEPMPASFLGQMTHPFRGLFGERDGGRGKGASGGPAGRIGA
ncbi:sterol desaturase family protein [Marivibrio halodurans]|uniref:Sterol desaturase family protein n=1 Tax=Marivibrio halodurans TaxID=2039722 RepID=A0A8J7SGY5_9PROT|nr:sterol desaturase family protein [Marivibrio halodurans]MBP5856028.1 sterol desaturase family protein [Marivibrio halodurans]